jgi:hypothetical protein
MVLCSHRSNRRGWRSPKGETWYLLGRAHLERAEFEPAGEALKRARELAPELGAVDLELSRWQVRRPAGDPALARWHYHRALQHGAPRDAAVEKEIAWEPLSKAIN